ncbi:MAG TPA: hypothetical protein VJB57_19780 [Dehalococcoidia bacterium]|nr:hypothetical protein [Dehalococcoidia bacterium]
MAVENRNLLAGTRLVANYKKQTHVCTIEPKEGGEGIEYVLEDGKRFKSPSAAGSAVMGGTACNGWRFWTVEGDEPKGEATATATMKPKAAKTKAAKAKKLIIKVNDASVPEGKTKWFCSACMKAFVIDGDAEPQVCPAGHTTDDPELTSAPSVTPAEEAE